MSHRALAWAALVSLAVPRAAHACTVCLAGSGDDLNRMAFFMTTVVLSLLPLGMIGGAVGWIYFRVRALRAEEESYLRGHGALPAAPPPPAPADLPAPLAGEALSRP